MSAGIGDRHFVSHGNTNLILIPKRRPQTDKSASMDGEQVHAPPPACIYTPTHHTPSPMKASLFDLSWPEGKHETCELILKRILKFVSISKMAAQWIIKTFLQLIKTRNMGYHSLKLMDAML